jgi:hypothetical protein
MTRKGDKSKSKRKSSSEIEEPIELDLQLLSQRTETTGFVPRSAIKTRSQRSKSSAAITKRNSNEPNVTTRNNKRRHEPENEDKYDSKDQTKSRISSKSRSAPILSPINAKGGIHSGASFLEPEKVAPANRYGNRHLWSNEETK